MLLLAAPAGAAEADTLPIKGSYGNKDGCAYARTGESAGSDDVFLLTPDAVTTAISYCEFKTFTSSMDGSFLATANCQEEGSEESADYQLVIRPEGRQSYRILLDNSLDWGVLSLCK